MKPGSPARCFRWFALRSHFKGKSRIEAMLEPLIPLPPIVDFPDGFAMEIDAASSPERWVYFRDMEPDISRFIRSFLRPGMVFADCGANLGFYSLLASRRVYPEGGVDAFEPTPSTFERLRRNVALNHAGNVVTHACALGARRATARVFRVEPRSHAMNALLPGDGVGEVVGECEVRPLDELILDGEMDPPDLMKIDVEGFELEVLRGAEALLRGPRPPTIIIELSRATTRRLGYEPEEILTFLRALRPWRVEWPFLGRTRVVGPGDSLPHYAALGSDHGANYIARPA
jgi:FkbM family methyltransferase